MIDHIKLFKYKGIDSVILSEISQTNVICGKNSSGKSSILESITLKENRAIGINLSNYSQVIKEEFRKQSKGFSNPSPSVTNTWFDSYLNLYIQENPTIYYDEINEIGNNFSISFKKYPNLTTFSNPFDFNKLFAKCFDDVNKKCTPILVPAKRQFVSYTNINLNEELNSDGKGTVNRLFFLKNHDFLADEFITYKKVHDIFFKITNCSFNIIPQTDNKLKLQFKVEQKWIDAENCGLGLKDLLFLITFIQSTDHSIYLVEEPESHLHADFQKKLLNFFKSFTDKQFIISTHSNIFLDTNQVDKIFYCWFENKVNISDKTSMSKIVDSLGYSITENLTSDAIILTEGPTDIPIIKKALILGDILNNSNVKFWPLGGDMMASLDLSLFSNIKNVFAIIDLDPGSTKVRNAFKKNCEENKIKCFQLERYSIENYLPLSLIKEAFSNQVPKEITELDVNRSIDEQIGFKSNDKTIKGKNHIMAGNLTKVHIENSDLWRIVMEIEEMLKND
jgi:predicted ATP-dependent endonuclease of OLD family